MTEPTVDLWALGDLCTPWCLHVAVTLRVAERLEAGPTEVRALADATESDPVVLEAILDHLVARGVFASPAPGHFALNDAARPLLDPGTRLGLDLDGLGGRMAHAWGTLLEYARTGRPAYDRVFGRGFWEDLDAHPSIAADFDALIGPAGHGTPNAAFEIAGGWESVRTVVDVGGGTGAMLAEVLRLHPHLRGTLLDLPRTVAKSGALFDAAGVTARAATVGQSFFDPLPAGADVYLLRGILNDWPDEGAHAILRRAAEAAGPLGRVVVLKSVSPAGPRPLSIEMVLLGGVHRTLDQFERLALGAGLRVDRAAPQPGIGLVVECRPV